MILACPTIINLFEMAGAGPLFFPDITPRSYRSLSISSSSQQTERNKAYNANLSNSVLPSRHRYNANGCGENAKILEEGHVAQIEKIPSNMTSAPGLKPKPPPVDYVTKPFSFRHGRRYLRDPNITYPLPVDLVELHRQNLRTLLLMNVFGAPFCSTLFDDQPPKKVLEVACGTALWSSACHDYFKRENHTNISFTGLDIAPLAPDHKRQGMDWRFVQHDLRKLPLPFEDEEFDFIFAKDTSFCRLNPTAELMRYLKPDGVIEIWESDVQIRCILPYPSKVHGVAEEDTDQAEETATYILTSETGFTQAQNAYVQDFNSWAKKAFDKLKVTTTPCAIMSVASKESSVYKDVGSQRVAVPFGEVRWEREGIGGELVDKKEKSDPKKPVRQFASRIRESRVSHKRLTNDQAALRRTALTTTIGLIESLEPILRVESGMKQDEWDRWWAGLNADLLENEGTLNGECHEIGAWWARKK